MASLPLLRAAVVELQSVHLHLEPVRHLLVGNGFGVGVAGNAERADEKRRLRDGAVPMMDRDGGAGPDDELKLQFEAVSRLDPEEKKVIRSLLDSMILRHEAKRWSGTG
jgi:hypothetical protein